MSCQVGTHHELSAGLLIGGKAVKEEAVSLNRMNILVATPGEPASQPAALGIQQGLGFGTCCTTAAEGNRGCHEHVPLAVWCGLCKVHAAG
jgi:hypothetical protein